MRVSLACRRFRFRCAVWACVLGRGLGCAPPFLAGLSGCVFCAFFFFLALWCRWPGDVVCVCMFRCPYSRWAAVPGLVLPVLAGWSPCASLGVLSSVPSRCGASPPFVLLAGGLVAVGCFRAAPPPFFFAGGGGGCLFLLCLPWAGARTVAGVWCGWSLATPGGGSCVLLPATPGWVLLPVVVAVPRHSWPLPSQPLGMHNSIFRCTDFRRHCLSPVLTCWQCMYNTVGGNAPLVGASPASSGSPEASGVCGVVCPFA